jgi:hypothetical protein
MDDVELKRTFALELLRTPADPFRAALSVFESDVNRALRVAVEWPKDAAVKAEVARLRGGEGELALLPTKADLARSVWDRAQGKRVDDESFVKLSRLYAEVMDYLPKTQKIENSGKLGIYAIPVSSKDELL